MTDAKYDRLAIWLHWFIAAMMIVMLFFGEELMDGDEGGGNFLPSLHISLGSAILALSLIRLLWRGLYPPPALPVTMPAWEQRASVAGHMLFYVLMIGLPITGWLAFPAFVGRHATMASVTVFGLFPVPGAPTLGGAMGGVHNIMSKIGIAILILHVLAALKHQFINRDGILRRMLPM